MNAAFCAGTVEHFSNGGGGVGGLNSDLKSGAEETEVVGRDQK